MEHEIVGFLKEQGYDDHDIGEMLTPMEQYNNGGSRTGAVSQSFWGPDAGARIPSDTGMDLGTPLERDDAGALRAILTVARDSRRRPGPQAAVAPGALQGNVKPVRVDSEESYRNLRRAMDKRPTGDLPHNAPSIDDLAEQGQRELMGEARGVDFYTAERPIGLCGLLSEQACLLCGTKYAGTALCQRCRQSPRLQALLGFGERGAASDIYGGGVDSVVGYTARQSELTPYQSSVGYTARQMELDPYKSSVVDLLGDLAALETPSTLTEDLSEETIRLSFSRPDMNKHIASWQHGPDLYSSIRMTGWDGAPRVLTATMPYAKSMGVVVGYATRAGVPPAQLIGMAHPLAQQLGASSLLPRLAASSPAVLGAARAVKKAGPLIVVTGRV